MKEIHNLEELFKFLAKENKLFEKRYSKAYNFDIEYSNFTNQIENKNLLSNLKINNELLIDNIIFFNANYKELFDKFNIITFKKCTFKNCSSNNIISTLKKKLIFENCTIEGIFQHIFCESIIFKDSKIDNYFYDNPSEDKKEIKNLLFVNSKIDNLMLKGVVIKKQLIKNDKYIKEEFKNIDSLILKKCSIERNFIIDASERKIDNNSKLFKINTLDLTDSTFEKNTKVKIQFCDINVAIFHNTKFRDLADFYQSKFGKVDFERTDFEKISVFSESEFNCDVDFKYTKFLGKSIFRDTIISGKFSLRNSIFDDEANFLDITSKSRKIYDEITNDYKFVGEPTDINVADRETARIIKNFYDNSNNIIEANRFYKLEMKKRMEEYNSLKKSDYRTFEKLIFTLHKWSSNHSQNWFLAFFWIISITFLYSYLTYDVTYYKNEDIINKELLNINYIKTIISLINPIKEIIFNSCCSIEFISIINCILIIYITYCKFIKKFKTTHSIIVLLLVNFYILYAYLTNDSYLKHFSNSLNPFSIMTGKEKLSFLGLIYKTTIAYLIYQLIVSIRQNTRRK